MRRVVLLLALVACEPPEPLPEPAAPVWVYAPPPTAWPHGDVSGRIGRGQAPQPTVSLGITGTVRFPLYQPTLWAVPGDGPARAVVYGVEGVTPRIELIEIDPGRVVWRDAKACAGPVVAVTARTIVCADASGVRGVTLDGTPAWQAQVPFIALSGTLLVAGGAGETVVLDADTGAERARVNVPAGIGAETVIASCGDGRELFAAGTDGKLVRIADVKGAPAVTWSVAIGAIDEIDACTGDGVLVRTPTEAGGTWLAVARASGAITGRVEAVRGLWPARDGSAQLELATSAGVATWSRDLSAQIAATTLPPLGALLATRGDRRLVRATPRTAVLLDRQGVRAYLPLAWMGAVLGDAALVAGSWSGSGGETVRRVALPPREERAPHVLSQSRGVALPAELRDLPETRALDEAAAIAKVDTAKHAVVAAAVDPHEPDAVYAVVLEAPAADATTATVARASLGGKQWTWQRADGCGPGTPLAVVLADDVVACAARGDEPGEGTVRATSRAGHARWEWEGDTLDGVQAGGDTVLVHAADRAVVLDAATGRVRGRLASDDGGPVRAAIVVLDDGNTLLVAYERGHVIARWPRFDLKPVWTLAVDGVVRALAAGGEVVLVELEDGDAYRLDPHTGARLAVAGIGLAWSVHGDLIAGAVASTPIPGPYPPKPAGVPMVRRTVQGRRLPPPPPEELERPRLWTPIPPPPMLGPSWQLAMFEPSGAARVRNDYAVADARVVRARGPAGSPIVIAYGEDGLGALVLDPRTGDPLRRVALPPVTGAMFSTVVNGSPVAGAVLAQPLRIVLF